MQVGMQHLEQRVLVQHKHFAGRRGFNIDWKDVVRSQQKSRRKHRPVRKLLDNNLTPFVINHQSIDMAVAENKQRTTHLALHRQKRLFGIRAERIAVAIKQVLDRFRLHALK